MQWKVNIYLSEGFFFLFSYEWKQFAFSVSVRNETVMVDKLTKDKKDPKLGNKIRYNMKNDITI